MSGRGEQEAPITKPGTESPRLVVVDDEPALREMVAEYLGRHGFSVRTADGGAALDALLAETPADALILDVNMPGEDGFSIARRIRAGSAVPILMLTAADDIVDRVVGLELGADDYLTKPFDLRELRARIRTVLRRSAAPAAPVAEAEPPSEPARKLVRFGIASLDLEAHLLRREDGTDEHLTAMEYELLAAFARNPNRVLTRERLLDLAGRDGTDPFDRSIDIRVTRIRKKIEADPAKPAVIRTVRGAGYMFVPPPTGKP
jgi:two-component system, OmpR family, response regulator